MSTLVSLCYNAAYDAARSYAENMLADKRDQTMTTCHKRKEIILGWTCPETGEPRRKIFRWSENRHCHRTS